MRSAKPSYAPTHLRTEFQTNPIGLGNTQPTLSWQIAANAKVKQIEAFEIEAASSAKAFKKGTPDLWQSGKVSEPWATSARYKGKKLTSRTAVYWRVRVWPAGGEVSAWSSVAQFELGLLAHNDWVAQWIAAPLYGSKKTRAPAPHFRKNFQPSKAVHKARLHITARGLYICAINGQSITQDELAPGWTDYAKRIPVRAYDVSSFLQPGTNTLGIILGDGWFCGRVAWKNRQNYGERPSLLAQLEIEYSDGTTETIATDDSWRWKTGALLENDIISGESHDAR